MTKRALLGLIVLACCVPTIAQTTPPAGKTEMVEVTVTGAGMDKDEAMRDALRKAVERGAGTYIYSQSQTKDFALVRDTVLTRAAGFVHKHTVISAAAVEDGTWEVKIKATVSVKGIQDYWAVTVNLLKQMGRPKIMVFIRERIGLENQPLSTVQTRIENLLLKSGFLLVDKSQLKAIDAKDLQAAFSDKNPAKAQAIAKRFGAQLFITGVANAEAGEVKRIAGITIYPYQADANIRTFRTDTAQLLSSIPGAPARSADRVWRSAAKKALDAQAQRIAPKVRMDILRFWQDALAGRGEVKLHIEGVSFKQYVAIKKALKTVKQIKDVTTKYHNKIAECSIQSDVNAETLAEAIIEVMENLEIEDVTQNVIKAKYQE